MIGISVAADGRVVDAPELHPSLRPDHSWPLLVFSLAVFVPRGVATQWLRVRYRRGDAQQLAERLTRGAECYVEGKLQVEVWAPENGDARACLTVLATVVQPIGLRRPAVQERDFTPAEDLLAGDDRQGAPAARSEGLRWCNGPGAGVAVPAAPHTTSEVE